MAQLELLKTGCTGGEVIDTINAIIARLNDGAGITISYNDLTDKPTVNGVELKGALNTAGLLIAMADCTDYTALLATLATRAYADAAETRATAAAQAAVQEALATKLDANPDSIPVISALDDDDYVAIATADGLRRIRVDRLSDNVAVRTVSTRSLERSISTQLKVLTVTGAQDGENAAYIVAEAYVPGTQLLFLNGQLLTQGADYSLTAAGFTMLEVAPTDADKLIFMAVPK